MTEPNADVLIIGNGLGAAAIAKRLVPTGASITMLPGAGKSRSTAVDGGVVNPATLVYAFGDGADAPLDLVGDLTVFRRDQMESWALRKLGESVTHISHGEEREVLPSSLGNLVVSMTTGDIISARMVILTEGANPKIGIAAGLRPDFEPVDMVHFGRANVMNVESTEYLCGSWRTSWGMPAGYQIVPQPGNRAIVTVSARIENIMRGQRHAKDALADLLDSDLAVELGIDGPHNDLSMELVPLRSSMKPARMASHNLMISLCGCGVIDASSRNRWDATISAGAGMGAEIAAAWPDLPDWEDTGTNMATVFIDARTPYHDDKETGFIEEGPGPRKGLLGKLFSRSR